MSKSVDSHFCVYLKDERKREIERDWENGKCAMLNGKSESTKKQKSQFIAFSLGNAKWIYILNELLFILKIAAMYGAKWTCNCVVCFIQKKKKKKTKSKKNQTVDSALRLALYHLYLGAHALQMHSEYMQRSLTCARASFTQTIGLCYKQTVKRLQVFLSSSSSTIINDSSSFHQIYQFHCCFFHLSSFWN